MCFLCCKVVLHDYDLRKHYKYYLYVNEKLKEFSGQFAELISKKMEQEIIALVYSDMLISPRFQSSPISFPGLAAETIWEKRLLLWLY